MEELKTQEVKVKPKFDFKAFMKRILPELIPYGGLLVCLIIFSILPPLISGNSLYKAATLKAFLLSSTELVIVSLGAIFIYSMGNMDVSLGPQIGVVAIVMVLIMNATQNIPLAIIVGLLITTFFALVNAAVGELLHLPAIIGSLFLMFFAGGFQTIFFTGQDSLILTKGLIVYKNFKTIPVLITAIAIVAAITFYLFKFTKLGKYSRAIGTNETFVKQSGVNTLLVKFLCYGFLGITVVIAALFEIINLNGLVDKSAGSGFHMEVMIALILGGMPLNGGMKSRISCAIVGSFTYKLISLGLTLIGIDPGVVSFITAIIFFVVVAITCRKSGKLLAR